MRHAAHLQAKEQAVMTDAEIAALRVEAETFAAEPTGKSTFTALEMARDLVRSLLSTLTAQAEALAEARTEVERLRAEREMPAGEVEAMVELFGVAYSAVGEIGDRWTDGRASSDSMRAAHDALDGRRDALLAAIRSICAARDEARRERDEARAAIKAKVAEWRKRGAELCAEAAADQNRNPTVALAWLQWAANEIEEALTAGGKL